MIWRRREKSDTWHFNTSCRWFPIKPKKQTLDEAHLVERSTKPKSGEFCNECMAKNK